MICFSCNICGSFWPTWPWKWNLYKKEKVRLQFSTGREKLSLHESLISQIKPRWPHLTLILNTSLHREHIYLKTTIPVFPIKVSCNWFTVAILITLDYCLFVLENDRANGRKHFWQWKVFIHSFSLEGIHACFYCAYLTLVDLPTWSHRRLESLQD